MKGYTGKLAVNNKWKQYGREGMAWLLLLLRFGVGLTIMYSGWKLMRDDMYYGVSLTDDNITPIFIFLVGVYCSFSGLLNKFKK
ncbi:hypothetical protein [Desulfogranum japonicum]|uniref:hypothetical protein n=1 Tax=Desulfogranum japonicum TaxID=231447 RepID=UPI000426D521|nr:hypothetical protein [Desulfogranum japonicum]